MALPREAWTVVIGRLGSTTRRVVATIDLRDDPIGAMGVEGGGRDLRPFERTIMSRQIGHHPAVSATVASGDNNARFIAFFARAGGRIDRNNDPALLWRVTGSTGLDQAAVPQRARQII